MAAVAGAAFIAAMHASASSMIVRSAVGIWSRRATPAALRGFMVSMIVSGSIASAPFAFAIG